jgi:nucleoside-diphosphate-sugar epimerase
MKQTILITGSEGSLAQWIINLLKDKYTIIGVDNCNRHGISTQNKNYKFYQLDLTNSVLLDQIFNDQPIDYVLHCAAQIYGVKGFHKYPADILANNVVSTSNILQKCVAFNVKKIGYISSSMVYENCKTFPLREEYTNTSPAPTTGYGLSKLVGERLVEEFNRQYGLKYVIWRPFNIVSPFEVSEDEAGIAHVMADFIQKIIVNKDNPIEIFGDGNQVRCFTNINDIATIISKSSFESVTDNQIYNLGSEVPTKIIDLADIIYTQSGRSDQCSYKFVDIYADDVKMRVPDCSKAKAIGFQHSKTIKELVIWCISNLTK